MKKKRARRKRSIDKKSQAAPIASTSTQITAGRKPSIERPDIRHGQVKKDAHKKVEAGVSAPKRFFTVARQFLVDSRGELKKVTWPTRKELLSTTAVVIVLVLLVAFFLGIVDLGLVKIIKNVIK